MERSGVCPLMVMTSGTTISLESRRKDAFLVFDLKSAMVMGMHHATAAASKFQKASKIRNCMYATTTN
jgi:hypothetical protein